MDRDRLTLAEEVLLSEPATDGRMVYGGFTIGAAALVELAVRGIVVMGRVRLWGQRLTLVDDAPVGIESLDVAINVLAGRQRPWTARAAIWKVSEPVSASAVMELNRRGIVRARGLPMRHGGWLELLDFELRHRTLPRTAHTAPLQASTRGWFATFTADPAANWSVRAQTRGSLNSSASIRLSRCQR
ncbi:GPP34 family phosphoprotein [Homoserinimonas sp. A447]